MKRKHRKTLELIFNRPVSGSIKWDDIEALFVALGAEVSEREGSIGHTQRQTLTKVRPQAFANGWKATELHHEYHDS